jgi:hypothetical protein
MVVFKQHSAIRPSKTRQGLISAQIWTTPVQHPSCLFAKFGALSGRGMLSWACDCMCLLCMYDVSSLHHNCKWRKTRIYVWGGWLEQHNTDWESNSHNWSYNSPLQFTRIWKKWANEIVWVSGCGGCIFYLYVRNVYRIIMQFSFSWHACHESSSVILPLSWNMKAGQICMACHRLLSPF